MFIYLYGTSKGEIGVAGDMFKDYNWFVVSFFGRVGIM